MKIDRKLHRESHYEDKTRPPKEEDPLKRARRLVENTIGTWPEEILGYKFKDNTLLLSALTHTSFYNESHPPWIHYQRLEFLGDAVLEYISSEYLYNTYPDIPEGVLTKKRVAMVREEAFAGLAQKWNLSAYILVGRGDIALKQARLPSIMADVVEAICAAIYLDGGLDELKNCILPWLKELDEEASAAITDYKTILQEKIQPLGLGTPTYHIASQSGPAHNPTFIVEVTAGEHWRASGTGHSVKAAGHEAAKALLKILEKEESEK